MAYEHYKEWLKKLPDSRLNEEIAKNKRNRDGAQSGKAADAWELMLNASLAEMRRRDNVLDPR